MAAVVYLIMKIEKIVMKWEKNNDDGKEKNYDDEEEKMTNEKMVMMKREKIW